MMDSMQAALLSAGVPESDIIKEADPVRAIEAGLVLAGPGDLLVLLVNPEIAIPCLKKTQVGRLAD
jgi:hypothetical protein